MKLKYNKEIKEKEAWGRNISDAKKILVSDKFRLSNPIPNETHNPLLIYISNLYVKIHGLVLLFIIK